MSRTPAYTLVARAALLLGALIASATACGSSQGSPASHRHHHQHAGAGSSGSTGTTDASLTAGSHACATASLAVWLGVGEGGGAAGSTYYPVEFTNVSDATCHLYGYPGVSAYNGRQVGNAAQRNAATTPQTVTLAPGATAHAVLQITDVGNFPPAQCRPVTATAIKVYPPGQLSAAFIPFPWRACSADGPNFLSVEAVQPALGIPGHP
jgi:hypothetical protein